MRFLLCLALCLMAASVQAQVLKSLPDFRSSQSGVVIDRADWAQFNPGPVATSRKPDFYLRCMAGPDPILSGDDQRAMCACMAARQAEVDASNADQYWFTLLKPHAVTPYETFVTKVFAPCMFIQARPDALDECRSRTSYRIQFATQRKFDEYCACYAQAAERYTRAYAQPLMAAKLAENDNNGLQALSDPARLVTQDGDYQIYMAARRQDCIQQYGIDNMRPR